MLKRNRKVKLEAVSKIIFTGTRFSKNELADYTADHDTGIHLVRPSGEMISLKELPDKSSDKVIKNGDVIINRAKASSDNCITVARIGKSETLISTDNLIVIRLDDKVVLPYFLKAYLETEGGKKKLDDLYVGATVSMLPLEALKSLLVPVLDAEKQKKIAHKQMEIDRVRNNLRCKMDEMRSLLFGEN